MGARCSVIILVNCSAPLLTLPIRRIPSPVVRVKEQIEYFQTRASSGRRSTVRWCEIGKKPAFFGCRRYARKRPGMERSDPQGIFYRIFEYFQRDAIRTQTRGQNIKKISPSVLPRVATFGSRDKVSIPRVNSGALHYRFSDSATNSNKAFVDGSSGNPRSSLILECVVSFAAKTFAEMPNSPRTVPNRWA